MTGIIVKNYEHFNRAMGKHITSKKQYKEEMAKGGYVTFKEGERLASKHKKENRQTYDNPKSMDLIRDVSMMKPDKHGKIKLSGRQIEAMKKAGVNFDPKFKPTHIKGGF